MMATATNSGPAAARNTNSPSVTNVSNSGPVHSGLVEHALLSPTVQVQVLSVVDATGSATMGDIIAELSGHEDPVGAIFALITADVLTVLSSGTIDANTIVARAYKGLHHTGDTPVVDDDAGPAEAVEAGIGADALSVCFANLSPALLPDRLDEVHSLWLQPRIIVADGAQRTEFGRVDCLQRPGVYILLRGRDAYVGYGAEVGFRIIDGRQMPGGNPDCIISIADAMNGLSTDDARALERIIWSAVAGDTDFVLINGVPDGAAIEPDRYDQLSLFASHVVLTLRQAGLMFLGGSAGEHIAGPVAEPGRLGAPRRINELPDGRIMELNFCGLTALAAERDDGSWLLLRGSDVRINTAASASSSASFQRSAWLHSGLLEPTHDGSRLVVMHDIVFSSGRAVSHFVAGSKSFGPSAWRPVDEDDTDAPAPAL